MIKISKKDIGKLVELKNGKILKIRDYVNSSEYPVLLENLTFYSSEGQFSKYFAYDKENIINIITPEKTDTKPLLPTNVKKVSSKDVQVGGKHYLMPVQPIDFIEKNNLTFAQGNVIKYITRYKLKNGKEDLLKAKHYIDLILEREYPE